MSAVEVLKHLEANMHAAEKLLYLMQWGEDRSCVDILEDVGEDCYRGYEYLLPMLLLTVSDPAVERVRDRLFLQWFRSSIEAKGEADTINSILAVLREEQRKVEAQESMRGWRR